MNKINFVCKNNNEDEIPQKIIKLKKNLFPQVHTNSCDMANLSKEIKEYKKDDICILPFCSTVEVEALGGKVNLGNEKVGPRVKDFAYKNIDELKNLKNINLTNGRIKELLDAIEILAKEDEIVALNISGPFTIATSLIDPMIFYKAIRKDEETIKQILKKIEKNIIIFLGKALEKGVSIISFSDSVASVDIVGPYVYKNIVGDVILDVLKGIEEFKRISNFIVHICAKTSIPLESYGFIRSTPIKLENKMTYGQAMINIIQNKNDIFFIGHSCMKKTPSKLKNSKVWKIERL